MKCFVTGANGFIGSGLVQALSRRGDDVYCLVRSQEKFESIVGSNIYPILGDLDNLNSLLEGTHACDIVYHLAGFTKPWSNDANLPYRINVQGTHNLLEASLKNRVRRFIFTSSAAVFGPSENQQVISEDHVRVIPYFNEYESTKAMAELLALEFVVKGLEVIILNPTRVFGPGKLNESNSITKIIKLYQEGKWRIIPGDGTKLGNYVFIDDVIDGHIQAADMGKPGERYILGGENITFNKFFTLLAQLTGNSRFLIHLPLWILILIARFLEFQNKITGIPPPVTSSWIRKYFNDWCLSSEKATLELGYKITPFNTGVRKTLSWLTNNSTENGEC
jgi:NAD+-dependent farnesol dehydrogenase